MTTLINRLYSCIYYIAKVNECYDFDRCISHERLLSLYTALSFHFISSAEISGTRKTIAKECDKLVIRHKIDNIQSHKFAKYVTGEIYGLTV